MEPSAPPSSEQILHVLRHAGEAGLSKTALAKSLAPSGKRPRSTKEAKAAAQAALLLAVQRLEADGQVLNVGSAKSPRYLLPEFDRRLEWACETLEGKATPGRATVYKLAALRKGHPKGVTKTVIDEAVEKLVREGRLLAIQPGKSTFYLHARSVAPLIPPELLAGSVLAGAAEGSRAPTVARPGAFSPQAIREAYALLVREGGFADVPISDLQQRSGVDLADLQEWLLEQSRAGRAAPTRGDWSLAGPAARAAAIAVRGEPHLQVRLL